MRVLLDPIPPKVSTKVKTSVKESKMGLGHYAKNQKLLVRLVGSNHRH